MDFETFIARREFALSEGSIYERLRRDPRVKFDDHIYHGGLIYDPVFAAVLEQVHREYLDVGQKAGFAMYAVTDTWRTSADRIARSAFHGRDVNGDNARFLRRIRDSYGNGGPPIFICGQAGPRGDAYKQEEAPPEREAQAYHRPHFEGLAAGGVDFLAGMTLPALGEARGMARAMAATGLPYVLSFVIRPDGTLLDGNTFAHAIQAIDGMAIRSPAGFAVNCVYPTVFRDGLAALEREAPGLSRRIISFASNTSARSPEELDGMSELQTEDPKILADLMIEIHGKFGVPIMGGCCGTDTSHIAALAAARR